MSCAIKGPLCNQGPWLAWPGAQREGCASRHQVTGPSWRHSRSHFRTISVLCTGVWTALNPLGTCFLNSS